MMSLVDESLTYHAALKVLGRPESRLVGVLDAAATAGLVAWASGAVAAGRDAGPALGLLEIKNDVVGCAHEVVRRVSEWRSGLARFDRSQRLAAAHAVLVVASYFRALQDADLPVPAERLRLSAAEQAAVATGGGLPEGYRGVIEQLVREGIPMPEPHRPYAQVRSQLAGFYARLSARLLAFVSGLAVWDALDERQRERLQGCLSGLPAVALDRYDESYRDLAADNREFEVWAGLAESRAAGNALAQMSSLLAGMAARQSGQRPRMVLRSAYQAGLADPIAGSGQAPAGVVMPSLAEAYVTPACKIAEIGPGDRPSEADW